MYVYLKVKCEECGAGKYFYGDAIGLTDAGGWRAIRQGMTLATTRGLGVRMYPG